MSQDVVHGDNEATFNKYWDHAYADRNVIDLQSARNRLRRGIRALGNISLHSGAREQIQKAIATVVQTFLDYIRRDIKVRKDMEPSEEVLFLTEAELRQVLKHTHVRRPLLLAIGRKYYQQWLLDMPTVDRLQATRILKKACISAFPDRPEKEVAFLPLPSTQLCRPFDQPWDQPHAYSSSTGQQHRCL
ncbi:MAG: hypothetical protein H7222_02150 [Methylotenera sp.]|nr:hypothetical protein [Oligoflexia bacterium]